MHVYMQVSHVSPHQLAVTIGRVKVHAYWLHIQGWVRVHACTLLAAAQEYCDLRTGLH